MVDDEQKKVAGKASKQKLRDLVKRLKVVEALRERVKLSQTVLASVLNTSASTVRKWEIGEKHPSGPSLKLLSLLDRKGLDAVL